MNLMRVFIAVEVPFRLKQHMSALFSKLKAQGLPKGKHVSMHNYHITVAFIGEVPMQIIPAIGQALHKASKAVPPFSLTVAEPHVILRPKVLALRVQAPPSYYYLLNMIQTNLKPLVKRVLVQEPHITLLRLQDTPLLMNADFGPESYTVGRFVLMQSTLTAAGPIYKKLASYQLNKHASSIVLRSNVAMCVLNPQNEVLLVRHAEHRPNDWQFPQGGIKTGESTSSTIEQELYEELGIKKFAILSIKERIYSYRWPKRLVAKGTDITKKGYVGQEQSLAIISLPEIRPRLIPDGREVVEAKWVSLQSLAEEVHSLRRPLAEIAVVEVKKIYRPRTHQPRRKPYSTIM